MSSSNSSSLEKSFITTALQLVDLKQLILQESLVKYILRAMLAGIILSCFYIGYYAIIVGASNISTGATLNLEYMGRFIGAIFFGFALAFIYFSKSELLTSNMMFLTIGKYYRKISNYHFLRILLFCYLGNFLGGLWVGVLLWSSTIMSPQMIELLKHSLHLKQNFISSGLYGHIDLLIRAILCNFFINFAMLLAYSGTIVNDFTKMLSFIVVVFIFMYMGLEHSIANTTLFTMAYFLTEVNYLHLFANLFFALLGNYIGGGVMVGLLYAYINDSVLSEQLAK